MSGRDLELDLDLDEGESESKRPRVAPRSHSVKRFAREGPDDVKRPRVARTFPRLPPRVRSARPRQASSNSAFVFEKPDMGLFQLGTKAVADVEHISHEVLSDPEKAVREGFTGFADTVFAKEPDMGVHLADLGRHHAHYHDSSGVLDFHDVSIVWNLIDTIPVGVANNQRSGRRVKLKSIQIRGWVFPYDASIFNRCVMILVYDRYPQAGPYSMTEILEAGPIACIDPNRNHNTYRFEIIRRWNIPIIGNNGTLVGANNASQLTSRSYEHIDEYIPLNDRPVVWSGGTATGVANIKKGNLFFLSLGNVTLAAHPTTGASYVFSARTRFHNVK